MDLSVTDLLPQPVDRARRDAPAKGRDGAFHDAMRAERDRERAARPEPEAKSRPAEEPRRADEPRRTTEPTRKDEPAASETEAPAIAETTPTEESTSTETVPAAAEADISAENAAAPGVAIADATSVPKPTGTATVEGAAGQKTQAAPEVATPSGQPAKPAAEIAGAAQAAGGNSQAAATLAATAAAPSLKTDMSAATRPQQTSANPAAGGSEQPAAGPDTSKLVGAGQGQQKGGQNAGGQGAQGGAAAVAKAALGGAGKVSRDATPDFRITADKPADAALPQTLGAATQGNGPPALLSTTALTVVSRTPPVHLPVTEQIGIRLQKAVSDGVDRISMSLKPAELGRVDIQMEVGFDGRVQAVISADRPDTLALLQRDARGLEQALQNAGLQADGDSLSFNLRDGGNSSRDDGSQPGGNGPSAAADSTADMPQPPARTVRLGGVDLSV